MKLQHLTVVVREEEAVKLAVDLRYNPHVMAVWTQDPTTGEAERLDPHLIRDDDGR